jgi:predicted RNA-binding Zn-ribbon protein involved in translation (DUF1610 family)
LKTSAPPARLRTIEAAVAHHFFCPQCGVHVYDRVDAPNSLGRAYVNVSVACIEDVDVDGTRLPFHQSIATSRFCPGSKVRRRSAKRPDQDARLMRANRGQGDTGVDDMVLDDVERPMPQGIEGRAFGAALPDLWCYEAGQAAFGDALSWFVRAFPRSA